MATIETSRFQSLPIELVQQIASYVPISAQVSSKLTCKSLFHRIPSPSLDAIKYSSQCEKKAVDRVRNEYQFLGAGLRYCVLCDSVQEFDCFSREDLPVCGWHDRWFFKTSEQILELREWPINKVWMMSREIGTPVWVTEPRVYCAHDRKIVHWDDRKCSCKCESCGHFNVVCHIRVCSHGELPLSWRLSKDDLGNSCVEEKHPGANLLRRYVNVPIVDIAVFEKQNAF